MPVDEEAIKAAQAELQINPNTSFRGVIRKYGLHRSTLQHREDGGLPHSIAHQAAQKLLPADEEYLVEWILALERSGIAPGNDQLCEMALLVLQLRNPNQSNQILGHNWHYRFRNRHPEIAPYKKTKLDRDRYQGLTFEAVGQYFDYLEKIIAKYQI
jgi:hypothetical protein